MTNRGRLGRDRERRSADRWTLIRRGTLLYAFGFVFEWIWSGTILFFYGAFFVAGAFLFTLRTRWLIVDRCARGDRRGSAAVVGVRDAIHNTSWLFEGWYTATPYRSPRRLLFDTFVNGTHPLLPWLAFLCAGMVLGRYLPLRSAMAPAAHCARRGDGRRQLPRRTHSFASTPLRARLLATDPFSRSLNYTISALGSSIVAFCVIGWIADRHADATASREPSPLPGG